MFWARLPEPYATKSASHISFHTADARKAPWRGKKLEVSRHRHHPSSPLTNRRGGLRQGAVEKVVHRQVGHQAAVLQVDHAAGQALDLAQVVAAEHHGHGVRRARRAVAAAKSAIRASTSRLAWGVEAGGGLVEQPARRAAGPRPGPAPHAAAGRPTACGRSARRCRCRPTRCSAVSACSRASRQRVPRSHRPSATLFCALVRSMCGRWNSMAWRKVASQCRPPAWPCLPGH